MKLTAAALTISLLATAVLAAAADPPAPAVPDPEYCAQRDADPSKCVIQDGPRHKVIVRKKKPELPPAPPPPPMPDTPGPSDAPRKGAK